MPVLWCKRGAGNGKSIGLFPGCTRSNNTKEGRWLVSILPRQDKILALLDAGTADGDGGDGWAGRGAARADVFSQGKSQGLDSRSQARRRAVVYFVKLICTVSSLFLDSFVVHSGRFGLSGFLLVLFGYFISEWVFL